MGKNTARAIVKFLLRIKTYNIKKMILLSMTVQYNNMFYDYEVNRALKPNSIFSF